LKQEKGKKKKKKNLTIAEHKEMNVRPQQSQCWNRFPHPVRVGTVKLNICQQWQWSFSS